MKAVFAPAVNSTDEAIGYVVRAIEKSGYKPGDDVMIALDAAAVSFVSTAIIALLVKSVC